MKRTISGRAARRILMTGTLFATVAIAANLALVPGVLGVGIRYNKSLSMPRGLWILHRSSEVYRPGETVEACPALAADQRVYLSAGFCPSGLEPLIKTVAAVAGDTVTITANGYLEINGEWIPASFQHPVDGIGRPIRAYPEGAFVVQPGEVWLLAPMEWSFDSRYFGPVKVSDIHGVLTPLRVWK
jgi:conjugative transfer signal peptidase TraF